MWFVRYLYTVDVEQNACRERTTQFCLFCRIGYYYRCISSVCYIKFWSCIFGSCKFQLVTVDLAFSVRHFPPLCSFWSSIFRSFFFLQCNLLRSRLNYYWNFSASASYDAAITIAFMLRPVYRDTTQLNSNRRRVELSCVALDNLYDARRRSPTGVERHAASQC